MKYFTNTGKTDRISRGIAGICVVATGIHFQSWWGLLAIPPLMTSISGWCPIYYPFGISTYKTDEQ